MTALVRCPLCGANEGYSSHQVDGPKLHLFCRGCRQLVTTSWSIIGADEDWNAAGVHAQSLRDEIHDYDMLREKMAAILSATAVVLKGPAPELTGWSWHDLPEHAQVLQDRIVALEAAARGALDALDLALDDSAELLDECLLQWSGRRFDGLQGMSLTLDANRKAAENLRATLEQKP